ncbi:MAG: hypothetical protein ACK47B_21715 [Armatimonadota bacterium]
MNFDVVAGWLVKGAGLGVLLGCAAYVWTWAVEQVLRALGVHAEVIRWACSRREATGGCIDGVVHENPLPPD